MSKYTEASQSLAPRKEWEMPDDHSLEYRGSATECLRLAATATDPGTRTALLLMAQKWMELAGTRSRAQRGNALLPDQPIGKR
jgi:hypothetical protein